MGDGSASFIGSMVEWIDGGPLGMNRRRRIYPEQGNHNAYR
jgi:hypothetical protein